MKILLTGSNGQLGRDFQKLFDSLKIEYNDFTHIINCAAYNDVDKAEIDNKVFLLNEQAPQKLAEFSKKISAIFVTYSTDFVFDGKKEKDYIEDDTPTPVSNYGLAKANGEKLTLEAYEKSFVIRTSWVFGKANNNFNTQVINWSKTRDKLNIVDDQISVPTYSKDLAEFSWKLIQTGQFGLYHITNNGTASKYDQAKYVKGSLELQKQKTSTFQQKDLIFQNYLLKKLKNCWEKKSLIGKVELTDIWRK